MGIMITLELVEQILTIIALISGIVVAWLGLNTWRQQIAGKEEHDLARRTLKVVYEFKETVFKIRTFGVFYDSETNSQTLNASMSEFNTIITEVEAFWGKTTRESVDEIKSIGYQLLAILELERREQVKSKKKVERNKILIASTDNSDEFSRKMESKIQNLESKLKPKLLIGKRLNKK